MKIPAILALAMLLLTAGCSSPTFYWYHPDRTIQEAKADYMECLDQARQKSGDMINDQHYDRLAPRDDPSGSKGPLKDESQPAADPRDAQEVWQERYTRSVIADCMREKGYLKVRPDRIPDSVHTKKLPEGGVAGQ
jgi:hypothetical protein